LHRAALGEGISIAPGMLFTLGPKLRHCLRLNCSFPFERCEKAIATLGHLASRLVEGSGRMRDARNLANATAR
jgi:DNA-binding transcriptional MocR family regulator